MSQQIKFLILAVLSLFLLIACQPTGEVGVTPDVTLPPAPTEAATPTTELPTATPPATDAPPATLDAFIIQLQAALSARDFPTMQTLMSDPFTVGFWLSEGVQYTPAEAVAAFENDFLPAGATLVWADPNMDLAPLLQGQPPASFLGPDKLVVATLLSYGWGQDAAAEAIQFIIQQPDGTYRWDTMLYSGFGLGAPTDADSVLINGDEATFYSGPGTSYEPVATVFGGQTYPVLGISDDGAWWRLLCFDDANEWIASCWVSADPTVTTPAMP